MPSTVDVSRVGAVIVTYASAHHIEGCLDALSGAGLGAIVVVDNDSPDDTVDVVRRRHDAGLVLVQQDNLGFGGGCNRGVRSLPDSCDLVLFCNPDARIGPNDVARLAAGLLAQDRRGLVGPRLRCGETPLTSAGTEPRFSTEFRPLLPRALGRFLPERRLPPGHDTSQPVGYVEGACMLARRAALEAVGGFDEDYFLCFEEIDLATRLHDRGWEIALVADAWADHCAGQSRAAIPVSGRDHALEGLLRYLRLHRGSGVARGYARAARVSLFLRAKSGRVPVEEYRRLRDVLRGNGASS
ncbi:MAG: glycosyl transferase family 2 [Frankiales bacterium]|nr:glycosyl transferase family 2 [Frankiales bacterium]